MSPNSVDSSSAPQHIDTDKDRVEMLERQIQDEQISAEEKTGNVIEEHGTRTPEEARLERRLLLKSDFLILPVIWITYLLAALVRPISTFLGRRELMMLFWTGSLRHRQCRCRWDARGSQPHP
jgi:hypothetical protein